MGFRRPTRAGARMKDASGGLATAILATTALAAGIAGAVGAGAAERSQTSEAVPALRPLVALDPSAATAPTLRPVGELRPASRTAGSLRGTGQLEPVSGSGARAGEGPLRRYVVEVEEGLPVNRAAFAAEVESTLADPRGWTRGGRIALQRVDSGPATFRVTLASRETTDSLCAPHDTHGRLSCFRGDRAVLNVWRWLEGSRSYGADLAGYRRYLVNHEVGHGLGHASHLPCPRPGRPAPLMMQQTRSVGACEPSPWPTASERASIK